MVENRNLTLQEFYHLIDPLRYESMTLDQFNDTMAKVKSDNFEMRQNESEVLFKYITKAVRTTGITMSVSKLGERTWVALRALLIEQMRDAIFKSLRPLAELFQKHDSNKDGFLEYGEVENLFLECSMAFKSNMLSEVFSILDPQGKQRRVSFSTLKFLIADTSAGLAGRAADLEPSQERAISEQTSQEEV